MDIGYKKGHLPTMVVKLAADMIQGYSGKLADIACGKGVLLDEVRRHTNKSVIGLDYAPDQLAVAQANGMAVVRGSMFIMPIRNNVMDIAVCFNTLYNFYSLAELEPFLGELARIVKINGKIVLDIRNRENIPLNMKYWWHMKLGKHPTVSHSLNRLSELMGGYGCRLICKKAVGFNNRYLAWGYVLVFEKEEA